MAPARWDDAVDVLVVGSGFAGMAAAMAADSAGARPMVIEKMNSLGGNSKMSGGGVAAVDSPKQREAGVEDSVDRFVEDVLAAGETNDVELVRTLGACSWPAVRRTIDELGVEYYDRIRQTGGHSVPRTYVAEGAFGGYQIIRRAKEYLERAGVELVKCRKLDAILTGADGVTGVEVLDGYDFRSDEPTGDRTRIEVRGGLVVAAGGFGHDPVRLGAIDDTLEGLGTTNHPGATSEVLEMLLALEANPVDLDSVQLLPTTSPEEADMGGTGTGNDFSIRTNPYNVWIDPGTGRRFTNESGDRRSRALAQLALGDDPGYPVLVVDATGPEYAPHTDMALRKGVVKEFDDLEGLAAHYGIPSDPLVEEIERYNAFVETGTDADHGKPLDFATKLDTPPWYGMRLWPQVHYTNGGVQIDTQARVIDTDGEPIPGLFAAGEITGGIHGRSRLTSNAIASCLVFGFIAGSRAAGVAPPFDATPSASAANWY